MSGPPIVQPGVLDAIEAHVNSAWNRKVGGILLGRPIDDVVRVEGALPARYLEAHAEEIAFPPSVWEEAYAALDRYPGAKIIGWYHSHPGTGVTLSDYDRRLHTSIFGEASNVALVLDPVGAKLAWFGWILADLTRLGSGITSRSVSFPFPVVHRAQGRPRRAAVASLVAVGIAAGAVGGYALSDWRTDNRLSSAESLTRSVQSQRAQIGRLRRALEQARESMLQNEARAQELQGKLDEARKALDEARRKLHQAALPHATPTFTIHYRVQAGDNLWDLAQTFYGDPHAWPKILDANGARLSDPDDLSIGQVLDIPISR
jgi:proteasome lid subunit RPN8/RPN11